MRPLTEHEGLGLIKLIARVQKRATTALATESNDCDICADTAWWEQNFGAQWQVWRNAYCHELGCPGYEGTPG